MKLLSRPTLVSRSCFLLIEFKHSARSLPLYLNWRHIDVGVHFTSQAHRPGQRILFYKNKNLLRRDREQSSPITAPQKPPFNTSNSKSSSPNTRTDSPSPTSHPASPPP
ncbi:hypothetical protein DL98DRAFT_516689 [Cadophora sp. DSE1049]|nr:hypothetical protein DL98DRAFT_516689 [Cadophora sp. DSE1049]